MRANAGRFAVAELSIVSSELIVHLSPLEKAEAAHGDLRFPTSSIANITVLDNAIQAVHGLRAPGAEIPGFLAVGTFRGLTSKIFAAIHHSAPRGVKIDLEGEKYDTLVIGCEDPEAIAELIRRQS